MEQRTFEGTWEEILLHVQKMSSQIFWLKSTSYRDRISDVVLKGSPFAPGSETQTAPRIAEPELR